jgi:hypothetical protein
MFLNVIILIFVSKHLVEVIKIKIWSPSIDFHGFLHRLQIFLHGELIIYRIKHLFNSITLLKAILKLNN